MFNQLSERLSATFERLRGRGALTEADVDAALREVRVALLEADVALPVVKTFVEGVRSRAVGQDVLKSVTPGQLVVKIVHDYLIEVLGADPVPLSLQATPPVVMMIVGLQGSGKTTSTGKIAQYLTKKQRKKVLMASLDVYRPAAQEQLAVLGAETNLSTLPIVAGEKPLAIAKRALKQGRQEGYDVILLDTAGRLHVDADLMAELQAVREATKPTETLLVADALTGQDAVTIAQTFHEKVGITGLMLTRVDGDARGGAALSMRSVTGCPIKLMGVGERVDQIEEFDPARIAGRILDMGDVVGLVEKATESFEQEEAEKLAKRMEKGQFDLNDMASQLKQITKMGGMSSLLGMLPGMGKMMPKLQDAGFDDAIIKRQLAIISSMTKKERRYVKLLNGSRRERIARGAGVSVTDVNRLLKQFKQMGTMMKKAKKLGAKGLKRHGLQGLLPH